MLKLLLCAVLGSFAVICVAANPAAASVAPSTQLVSTTNMALPSNGESDAVSTSADGRFVAFTSSASNLVPGDTNGTADVFVKDRLSGAVTLASIANDGSNSNGLSGQPSISSDGKYVAFQSVATNLISGDTNNKRDIFVRLLEADFTIRVSTTGMGAEADGHSSNPSFADGPHYLAFASDATNLVTGDTNGDRDVFVKSLDDGSVERASTDSTDAEANNLSDSPSISADGRRVAFTSVASNLDAGDTNGVMDVFVKDLDSGDTLHASTTNAGASANAISTSPALSADGDHAAFTSSATNLVSGDTNSRDDVFVKDLDTGNTVRANKSGSGVQATDGESGFPSLSSDGRYIAFMSHATNLVGAGIDTNNRPDVLIKDLDTDQINRASLTTGGLQANDASNAPAISANGQLIAFPSSATNLVPSDLNAVSDIFIRSLGVDDTYDPLAHAVIDAPATTFLVGDQINLDGSASTGAQIPLGGGGARVPISSYQWNIDGAAASGASKTTSFSTPGAKTIGLTVTDATGVTATTNRQITIQKPATPSEPAPPKQETGNQQGGGAQPEPKPEQPKKQPAAAPLSIKLASGASLTKSTRTGKIAVTVTANQPATVNLGLFLKAKRGSRTSKLGSSIEVRLTAAGQKSATLKLSRKALNQLRSSDTRKRVMLQAVGKSTSGTTQTVSQKLKR